MNNNTELVANLDCKYSGKKK